MNYLVYLVALLGVASAFTPVPWAEDELQIRNKLSLYATTIDTQNFDLLDQVFTQNVVVDYQVPGASVLNGLPAVKAYLVKALTGFVTQHTLSTTVVEQLDRKGDINSTIYLVANYLGQGNLTGTAAYVYGKYSDSWVKQKGEWKSKARTLKLIVSLSVLFLRYGPSGASADASRTASGVYRKSGGAVNPNQVAGNR